MLVLWFFVPSALNAQMPTVDDPGGVVNGASFAADAVVAGSEATVLGSNLASSFFFATSLPLPTILGDTTVSINGNPVPLLFVSPDRIRLQVPWELASETQVSLTVTTVSGGTSSPVTVNLASVGPGIFDASAIGGVAGDPAILKADFTLVTGSNPAPPGEVVLIFAAGLGPVTNQPLTGGPSPGNPLSETIAPTAVTIGGIPASVLFSGLTPGFVAFYQVNVEVPANVTVGPAVPVVLIVGGVSSNTVTMAIDPDPDNDGIPIPDDNCPFTANPSQADSDADATGNACDECINDFGPSDNAGCPRPEVPPGTVISSDPSTCDIVADGQFASNALYGVG